MNETNDPVRLQLGGSPEAQDLLRSAHLDVPTRAQLDQLGAKLTPTVSIPPSTSGVMPWLVGAAAVIGAVAILVVARDRGPAAPPAPLRAPIIAPPVVVKSASPIRSNQSPTKLEAASVETVPPASPATEGPPHRIKSTKVAKVDASPAREAVLPREMDLLGLAHQALAGGDFTRALQLATRHRELYQAGVMTEEREVIAIEALFKLGNHHAARTRFSEFGVKFSNSGYRGRLDRLLGDRKD